MNRRIMRFPRGGLSLVGKRVSQHHGQLVARQGISADRHAIVWGKSVSAALGQLVRLQSYDSLRILCPFSQARQPLKTP